VLCRSAHPPNADASTLAEAAYLATLKPTQIAQDTVIQDRYAQTQEKLLRKATKDADALAAWARSMLIAAAQGPGLAHLLALSDEDRMPLAQLLLHAATCHHYAVASAAADLSLGSLGSDSSKQGGSGAGAGAAPAAAGAINAWPYDEPCAEPLFAALAPQHQAWLTSDLLVAVWTGDARAGRPQGSGGYDGGPASTDTPLHASTFLALLQLAGIHAAAEARGRPPPRLLLQTRIAHACQWWLSHETFYASLGERFCGRRPDCDARERVTLPCGFVLLTGGASREDLVGGGWWGCFADVRAAGGRVGGTDGVRCCLLSARSTNPPKEQPL